MQAFINPNGSISVIVGFKEVEEIIADVSSNAWEINLHITYEAITKTIYLPGHGSYDLQQNGGTDAWNTANTVVGATSVVPSTIEMGTVLIKQSANYTDDIARVAKISSKTIINYAFFTILWIICHNNFLLNS